MAPSALAIFCDDIREEIGNKISIMGIYGTDIKIRARPPVNYPRLGVVIWIFGDVSAIQDDVTVTIYNTSKEKKNILSTIMENPKRLIVGDGHLSRIQAAISFGPIEFVASGRLEIEIAIGAAIIQAGQLDVGFDPPSDP